MVEWTGILLASASAASVAAPEIDRNAPNPISTITREDLDKLPAGRRVEDLIKACPSQGIPTVVRPIVDRMPATPGLSCLKPDDLRMVDIYREHNLARAQYGSKPLVWDVDLARGAASYAQQLTTLGRVHSSREGRKDIRENLLQSLRGGRSPKAMVGVWTAERRYFRPGIYPNVSTTGNWADVGPYTQMIWPSTTRLGCAIHSDLRYDWTVCRYSPPGNRDGSTILASYPPAIPDLPRMKEGGGMQQIDPPVPPPPPPPTASDPAPAGDEAQHPLRSYFTDALLRYDGAWLKCDREAMTRALAEMRYVIDELKKRRKAAIAAGRFSTVDPEEVQKSIDLLERSLRQQMERPPRGACPLPQRRPTEPG